MRLSISTSWLVDRLPVAERPVIWMSRALICETLRPGTLRRKSP